MSRRAGSRGHLLLEALMAGAVLLLSIAGVATAVIQSARDAAIARDDQEAFALAESTLERLRARPAGSAAWVAGVAGPTAVPGHPDWTVTTTIADVADAALPGVTHKRARVDVSYRTASRAVSVETLQWTAPP